MKVVFAPENLDLRPRGEYITASIFEAAAPKYLHSYSGLKYLPLGNWQVEEAEEIALTEVLLTDSEDESSLSIKSYSEANARIRDTVKPRLPQVSTMRISARRRKRDLLKTNKIPHMCVLILFAQKNVIRLDAFCAKTPKNRPQIDPI